jgi:hypothetical protein
MVEGLMRREQCWISEVGAGVVVRVATGDGEIGFGETNRTGAEGLKG